MRNRFGAMVSDYGVVDGGGGAVEFSSGGTVTFWTLRELGEQHTDLLDINGTPTDHTTTSDGTGGIAMGNFVPVDGPDNVWAMWASLNGGPRVLVFANDIGTRLPQLLEQLGGLLAAHTASNPGGHGTGMANLVDTTVGPPETRPDGYPVGWSAADQKFTLLAPSQVAGALLLNPPLVAGAYVGNVASPPDPSQGQNGNPWLRMQQPYSSGDNNPDAIQLGSTTSGGQFIKTNWSNGNNERRAAPSTPGRIADRVFEYAESLGGPSTGRFVEWSTNPAVAANREPLLGGYGTGHPSKPGWVVATRVMEGLTGVKAGGSYNALSGATFRGYSASTGAPTAGTWATGDVVIDAIGRPWLCTTAGNPGTWTGGIPAPVALTGENGATGSNLGARLLNGAVSVELAGRIVNNSGGTIASGTTLCTLPVGMRPPHQIKMGARYSGGGQTLTIETSGALSLGGSLTNGQELFLDGVTVVRTWL